MSAKERIAEYWKMNKKKIYAFCIAFIVVFIFKIIGTVFMVLNDEWNKMESPYDIQWEYQTTTMLSHARIALMNIGLSDDNFISNLIKKKQKQYYKAIKMKVPAEDLVIDIVGWTIEYFPYLYTKTNNDELNLHLKSIFNRLIEGKSKIILINERGKYENINTLLIYVVSINNNISLYDYLIKKITKLVAENIIAGNRYPTLVLKVQIVSLLNYKLNQKYPLWDKTICVDSSYILLKHELNLIQNLIHNFMSEIKKSKAIAFKIYYLQDASNKIEKFDREVCSKLNANYPSTEIQINH